MTTGKVTMTPTLSIKQRMRAFVPERASALLAVGVPSHKIVTRIVAEIDGFYTERHVRKLIGLPRLPVTSPPEPIKRKGRHHSPSYYNRRNRLFEILGDKCAVCGFSDTRALQIDHIAGGGAQDRAHFKSQKSNLYSYYRDHPDEARQKLQILCANCNWIKRHENQECGWPIK